jgi:hypothetical protein
MPKLNIKVAESMPPIQEGRTYEIVSAESVETEKNHYRGLRITGKDTSDNSTHVEMLWFPQDPAKGTGTSSKLGSFIDTFGDDTDAWTGKKFKATSWAQKDRSIKEIA